MGAPYGGESYVPGGFQSGWGNDQSAVTGGSWGGNGQDMSGGWGQTPQAAGYGGTGGFDSTPAAGYGAGGGYATSGQGKYIELLLFEMAKLFPKLYPTFLAHLRYLMFFS